jgi:hypothetical protein
MLPRVSWDGPRAYMRSKRLTSVHISMVRTGSTTTGSEKSPGAWLSRDGPIRRGLPESIWGDPVGNLAAAQNSPM